MTLQAVEARLPERAVAFEPPGDLLQRKRSELVQAFAADALLFHKLREAQYTKVLRDGGAALLEVAGERVDRRRPGAKAVEDRPTRRVGDGLEDVGVGSRSGHGGVVESVAIRLRTIARCDGYRGSELPTELFVRAGLRTQLDTLSRDRCQAGARPQAREASFLASAARVQRARGRRASERSRERADPATSSSPCAFARAGRSDLCTFLPVPRALSFGSGVEACTFLRIWRRSVHFPSDLASKKTFVHQKANSGLAHAQFAYYLPRLYDVVFIPSPSTIAAARRSRRVSVRPGREHRYVRLAYLRRAHA